MVNLKQMRGMPHASSAPRPRQPTASSVGDSDQPRNSEPNRPRKKPKIGTSKMSESVAAWVSATKSGGIPREQSHRSAPNEEAVGSGHGKEHAGKAGPAKAAKPASVLEFGRTNKHYYMALVDRVQDAGRIISGLGDKITELHGQIEELNAGAGLEAIATTEQRAIDLEGEVSRLKLELENAGRQWAELREQLKELCS
ncbi:unnamed protein product [Musa hybrid cultivar]